MATKKDLVEAYSFSRRRLVTAFVSGAPGGREVEPARPGRAILGGVALAVLLVAGGAVLGIIKSPNSFDFSNEGLVSEKESGANYLVLKGGDADDPEATQLRPLVNITSAMLILGPDLDSTDVSRDKLNEEPRGASIGILGAPATPPDPSTLIQTGWSACTGTDSTDPTTQTGIAVSVSDQPTVTPAPDVSFVVRAATSGDVYVIAQSSVGVTRGDQVERAYAYPVPGDAEVRGRILNAVAAETTPRVVPDQWITLFPPGGALTLKTFGIKPDQYGVGLSGDDAIPEAPGAKVGDLLDYSGTLYVIAPGQVVQLDEFARQVYLNLTVPGARPTTFDLQQAPSGNVVGASDLEDADWPTAPQTAYEPKGQMCALLDTTTDAQPGVLIATAERPSTDDRVAAEEVIATVDSGRGAFVLSGDFESGGDTSRVLIDDRGFNYPVGTGTAVEQGQLGYADVPPVEVPVSWTSLFGEGVPLTVDAARCPPSSDPDGGCS